MDIGKKAEQFLPKNHETHFLQGTISTLPVSIRRVASDIALRGDLTGSRKLQEVRRYLPQTGGRSFTPDVGSIEQQRR